MLNRFAGRCHYCGGGVPAKGGDCFKVNGRWAVAHLSCKSSEKSEVDVIKFSSGEEFYRNKKGRCEDAPCCGCCTI